MNFKLTNCCFKSRRTIGSLRFLFTRNCLMEKAAVDKHKMKGWQIHSYGTLNELQFSDKLRIPIIRCPNEVLVKVTSAGVNPIDVSMVGGYGSKLINILRCNREGIEFPLTFGREFTGVIAQKGMGICKDLQVGDEVWGVVPIQRQGSHSEYTVVPDFCLSRKPVNLNHIEAGCLLYAGLTAWSGLFISGQLGGVAGALNCGNTCSQSNTKKVLVLGASGGVGSIAIQILRAENSTVIATCSTDAIPLVKNLGAQHVIDYSDQTQLKQLADFSPYDIILDCAGLGPKYAGHFDWQFKSFVTFSSPLLKNVDESGIGLGMLKNFIELIESNSKTLSLRQGCVKWGYFVPAPQGIEYLKKLIERKKLLPQIDSTFNFENTKEAYEKVSHGHLRGKVVIDFINEKKNSQ
ncbi:reticulon-4-interacting protein 1 homolog, mitochondrial [Condylostylus longicornis]|uniref:reticulon-4-interacting protein 1 homolog, mitochondrial n=1 Tax=Condylostylus longicornis TaxID=2530218 RepID=UPI00244DF0D9|nr:reticulon-4-interacting protein 1 homolog, mitochondrial [Condylostylus longicornis]